jgi:hypothetical protein
VPDLLLLARRAASQPSRSPDVLHSVDASIDGGTVPVKTYIERRPDHVLGSVAPSTSRDNRRPSR